MKGRPLAVACAFRNLAFNFLLSSYEDDLVAPAWVVVQDRGTGKRIGRVSVGREAFAADALRRMQYDAAFLGPEQFVNRHGVR